MGKERSEKLHERILKVVPSVWKISAQDKEYSTRVGRFEVKLKKETITEIDPADERNYIDKYYLDVYDGDKCVFREPAESTYREIKERIEKHQKYVSERIERDSLKDLDSLLND